MPEWVWVALIGLGCSAITIALNAIYYLRIISSSELDRKPETRGEIVFTILYGLQAVICLQLDSWAARHRLRMDLPAFIYLIAGIGAVVVASRWGQAAGFMAAVFVIPFFLSFFLMRLALKELPPVR